MAEAIHERGHTGPDVNNNKRVHQFFDFFDFLSFLLGLGLLFFCFAGLRTLAVKSSISASSEAACANTRDQVGSWRGAEWRGSWCAREEADSWPGSPGEEHIRRRLLPALIDTKQP